MNNTTTQPELAIDPALDVVRVEYHGSAGIWKDGGNWRREQANGYANDLCQDGYGVRLVDPATPFVESSVAGYERLHEGTACQLRV